MTVKTAVAEATMEHIDQVFNADEMELKSVDPHWSESEMLAQDGIFFLKDVAAKMGIAPQEFKKHAKELELRGENTWQLMGLRKTWTHWQVRMKVFSNYLKGWQLPRVSRIDANWNGNTLLSQKGQYYLSEVCEKIPFSTHQIRHQIRKSTDPKSEYGVWKDPAFKGYLVDMDIFSRWIRKIWMSGEFKEPVGREGT